MRNRPFGVTLLALIVLFFSAAGLARAIQAVQKWEFLQGILPIGPGYLVIGGLFWFFAGLLLFWALWTMRSGVGRFALLGIVLYSINFLGEQLWLPLTPGSGVKLDNWPFLAFIMFVMLVWSYWEFFRPGLKQRGEERYERQSED